MTMSREFLISNTNEIEIKVRSSLSLISKILISIENRAPKMINSFLYTLYILLEFIFQISKGMPNIIIIASVLFGQITPFGALIRRRSLKRILNFVLLIIK